MEQTNGSPTLETRGKSFSRVLSQDKNLRIAMAWEKINLSVMVKDAARSNFLHSAYKPKQILTDISGKAVSGELLAIMGPTGCGKTSLMNILAGRVAGLSASDTALSGSIYINGLPREDAAFRRYSAYVLQDDRLYPHLTVHETLMMSAHFFLPDEITYEQKETLVMNVINELGLAKTRDTIIGDERVRGVSGGERKRANIAVQLISDPAVLFLDEPTSGLDSFQAQAVMEAMKNMALNGRLVISVIHQPRSSIFDMFDKLLLLSQGKSIFLGDSRDAGAFFVENGFPMPRFFNPADFYLDILSPDSRTAELDAAANQRIALLADAWKVKLEATSLVSSRASEQLEANPRPFTLQRFFRNLGILFWRAWSELSRDIPVITFKCILSTFFGCIIGAIYNNISNDQASIYNREGLLFIIVLNQAFNNAIGVATTFPKEKIIVNRERSAGAYDTLSYFFAKFLAEMPINVIPGIVFGTLIYWIVGLNPVRYGYFLLILLLLVVTAIALGLAVSAASPSADFASGIIVPIVIIPLIFGGFYINLDSLPIVANWVPYASFLRWAFQALIINEFQGETFSCSGGATSQCLQTGAEVINSLAFNKQDLRQSVLGLGCCLVIFLLSAVVFLELNRLTFLPLGHKGFKFRGQQPAAANESSNAVANAKSVVPVAAASGEEKN
jgi:ABC-type multidrug transport system ATPase subunit/ABC-type multidrug transport system permease subunit